MSVIVYALFFHNLFVINVEPVVAFEGGPVALDVTVTYAGTKELHILPGNVSSFPDRYDFCVDAPSNWSLVPRERPPVLFSFVSSSVFEPLVLRPKEKIRKTLVLHRLFAGMFPAGRSTFTIILRTEVAVPGGKALEVIVRRDINIEIKPPTSDLVMKLCERFLSEVKACKEDVHRRRSVIYNYCEFVLDSPRPELAPLLFAILAHDRAREDELRAGVFAAWPCANRVFVDEVLSHTPKIRASGLFRAWAIRESSPQDRGNRSWTEAVHLTRSVL